MKKDPISFWEWLMCPPWGFLDGLAHLLHAPKFVQSRLCDRFDEALAPSMEDDE